MSGTRPPALLRSRSFDSWLVLGSVAVAAAFLLGVTVRPDWLGALVLLDVWLLGYHHVIATFTRLTFDRESFGQHRFLVLGLPWIVFPSVFLVWKYAGLAALITIYFYWQWFHYTRQSYGVERLYLRKTGAVRDEWSKAFLYGLAMWGVTVRSALGGSFIGTKVYWVPVPVSLVPYLDGAALAGFIAWLATRGISAVRRPEERWHAGYVLSHVVIFVVGYRLTTDAGAGWLLLNTWHNLQYLLIVWLFNTNRFAGGVHPQHRLLSRLSQKERWPAYVICCLTLSTVLYSAVEGVSSLLVMAALPLQLVVAQALNFHHYIVDGVIWKLRKPAVRERLGAV